MNSPLPIAIFRNRPGIFPGNSSAMHATHHSGLTWVDLNLYAGGGGEGHGGGCFASSGLYADAHVNRLFFHFYLLFLKKKLVQALPSSLDDGVGTGELPLYVLPLLLVHRFRRAVFPR